MPTKIATKSKSKPQTLKKVVSKTSLTSKSQTIKADKEVLETKYPMPKQQVRPKVKRDYTYAVGKRKTSIARVRLYYKKGDNKIIVNEKDFNLYFPPLEFQQIITAPLELLGLTNKYTITIKVVGGGKRGQAESIRHGISRALVKNDDTYRKTLRGAGFLTRDARKKERKKPGLKRARRAPQWAKR